MNIENSIADQQCPSIVDNDQPHTAEYRGKRPWTFIVTSNFVRSAEGTNGKKLSAPARLLYLIIQSYVGPNSPHPFPKCETVASYMGVGLDTLRRYTKELIDGGWLIVEQRRGGWNQFCSNSYVLLDGNPYEQNPSTAQRVTAEAISAEPITAGIGTKSTQVKVQASVKSRTHEVGRNTSSKTVAPSAPTGGAPAPFTTLAGADAPAPPTSTLADATPESKAEAFIQGFKEWGKRAGLPLGITARDRQVVVEFFQENEDYKPRNLLTIMLGAWLMDPEAIDPSNPDRLRFWFCTKKGRRVFTFMKHLTEIQDELGWRGNEAQITKVLDAAQSRFFVKKQKLVE
jgi:hypothetical protein